MNEYPALTQLVGAYLHYDWPEEFGTVWAAVDAFAEGEPIADRLPAEVDRLLGAGHDEAALWSIVVDEMGSGYGPYGGETMAAWLAEVARRVRARIDAQQAE